MTQAAEAQSKDLVRQCQETGDTAPFGCLVRLHQGPLRGLLLRLTRGDAELADDLAQETFLSAFRALDRFRGDATFGTWLYRIAWNAFLQHERKGKISVLEDLEPEDFAPAIEHSGDIKIDLEKAMYQLKPEVRVALTLHFSLGLTHEETADALSIPLGTVKSHILRGREKLRLSLDEWRRGEESD